jgi:hypothetical protein
MWYVEQLPDERRCFENERFGVVEELRMGGGE